MWCLIIQVILVALIGLSALRPLLPKSIRSLWIGFVIILMLVALGVLRVILWDVGL